MNKDYRKGQKVIATLQLEDKGQDFLEIDVLENGVILGNSIMFENGRLSMIGVGTLDGVDYWTFDLMKKDLASKSLAKFYIYIKRTAQSESSPWKAQHSPWRAQHSPWKAQYLVYKVIDVKKAKKPNRFINKIKL